MSACWNGLSCENPSETCSFCVHGTPVKFECVKCHNEHRLTLLESKINNLIEWKDRQLTFKAEIVDELHKIIKRVQEIENGLTKRIGILGEALSYLSEENHKLKKTPHKCPVCEGEGRIALKVPLVTQNSTCYSISCVPCEGNGIIWG